MNVRDIKTKARSMIATNRSSIVMIFLFIHGLLHLLGFDHMTKKEEEIMFPLQKEILNFYKEKNNGQQRTS